MIACDLGWVPPTNHGYAVLEPSNRPYFLEPSSLIGISCTPSGMEKIGSLTPKLVDIGKLTNREREVLADLFTGELEISRPPFVCAWIESDLNCEDVAAKIASMLIDIEGRPQLIWRYYDPRVMALAFDLLTVLQREALLHGLRRWVFPWRGSWWNLEGISTISDCAPSTHPWPTPQQWKTISKSDVINRIHAEVSMDKCLAPQIHLKIQHDIVSALIEAETKLHLVDPEEQTQYARLVSLYGDTFTYDRRIEESRMKLANGQLSWIEFLDLVNEDEFSRRTQHRLSSLGEAR